MPSVSVSGFKDAVGNAGCFAIIIVALLSLIMINSCSMDERLKKIQDAVEKIKQ